MATPIYATPEELATYTGETAPANASVLLRSASRLVTDAVRAKFYAVDGAGLPVDAAQRATLNEATCVQAAAWVANNVNPLAGRAAVKREVAAKSGGGVSVTYASYAADAQARSDLASGDVLTSDALRVLRNGQMLTTKVQTAL